MKSNGGTMSEKQGLSSQFDFIFLCEKDLIILNTITAKTICSIDEIVDHLGNRGEYIAVLRTVHDMVDKGLLVQIKTPTASIYKLSHYAIFLKGNILAVRERKSKHRYRL
jgi:hypothetical protein